MITKIVIEKDGKKTKYIIKDEPKIEKEIDKFWSEMHDEMRNAFKLLNSYPKFTAPSLNISNFFGFLPETTKKDEKDKDSASKEVKIVE
jgi:hypothetical protein